MHAIIISLVSYLVFFYLSYTVRYYTKIILTHIWLTLIGIVTIPLVIWRPKDERNLRIMSVVTSLVMKIASDISFKVQGIDNMKRCKGSAIIVANHQSCLDGFGCSQYWFYLDPAAVVSKKALAYFGPLGLLLYLCGFVFIDRANTTEAKAQLDAQFKEMFDRNTKLLIFPEGTRNLNDSMLPFKKGAFHMAIKFQVPILPIVYSSQKDYYDVEKRFWNTRKFIIEALPAISTEGMTSSDVDDLTNSVREKMIEKLEEISK